MDEDDDEDELSGGVLGLIDICSYFNFLCSSDSFDLERERD